MRFPFSRRTDYAIRAAIELARQGDRRVKRHAIAAAVDAPATVVAQALADLVRGGLAAATAGPAGGYVLARPAGTISVADVVAAVGERGSQRCLLVDALCADGPLCALHGAVTEAQEAFAAVLAGATLDVLAGGTASRPGEASPQPSLIADISTF